jgi:hypothetical protein
MHHVLPFRFQIPSSVNANVHVPYILATVAPEYIDSPGKQDMIL